MAALFDLSLPLSDCLCKPHVLTEFIFILFRHHKSYNAHLPGEPFPVTAIYNSTEAEKGWQEIASSKGVTIPDGEMTHGRKITRRFNVTKVSDDAKRKICRILALDYCCLNIELPDICRGDDGDQDGDAVYCAMQKRNEKTMKYALQKFVLYPWKDP